MHLILQNTLKLIKIKQIQTIFLCFSGTQIHDLVSQIKVPVTLPSQPVSKTLLSPVAGTSVQSPGLGPGEKRRKIEVVSSSNNTRRNVTTTNGSAIAIVNANGQSQAQKARRLLATSNTVTTQIVVEDAPVSFQASEARPKAEWNCEFTFGPRSILSKMPNFLHFIHFLNHAMFDFWSRSACSISRL